MQSNTVMDNELSSFIHDLPKAELHLHVEGTLEPELLFELAERNSVRLPYPSIEAARSAYNFGCLQDFLNIYYQGMTVLLREEDFYDLTTSYLKKAASQNVRHAEIFFDPQAHTGRGVAFETVVEGISRALEDGNHELGISSGLVLCFLRDQSTESAMETLRQALPCKERIIAVGLDSAEVGYPPGKFKEVFDAARKEGFLAVAHAGEEGPPEYISEALDLLKARRIDHGIQCWKDEKLMERLIETQTPLTVCPISNVRLRIFDKLSDHNVKYLLERGLCVSIHSDDPAYFGGYIEENYLAAKDALGLSYEQIVQIVRNSFKSSFLSKTEKLCFLDEIERVREKYGDVTDRGLDRKRKVTK